MIIRTRLILSTSFYGAQVNVTSQTFIPKWKEKVVKLPNGREVLHYSGMDYQALVAIADALNFSANVIPTASFEEVCLWWFELNLPLVFFSFC